MSKENSRLTRLANMLTHLQSKRIITAKDIAEKFDISIRTVYRDIKTLSESGVPIITEEGKGYSVMPGFYLPPVTFSQEEANALITAEQLINKNKDQSLTYQYNSAITKIKSVLKDSQKEKTELLSKRIQVRNNIENQKTSRYLIQLQSTISNYQLIRIEYLSIQNKHSQREVEPFALYTTQDNWILIAFCRIRQEFRAFRIDHIQKLTILDIYFEPHRMTLQQYLEECRKKSQYP